MTNGDTFEIVLTCLTPLYRFPNRSLCYALGASSSSSGSPSSRRTCLRPLYWPLFSSPFLLRFLAFLAFQFRGCTWDPVVKDITDLIRSLAWYGWYREVWLVLDWSPSGSKTSQENRGEVFPGLFTEILKNKRSHGTLIGESDLWPSCYPCHKALRYMGRLRSTLRYLQWDDYDTLDRSVFWRKTVPSYGWNVCKDFVDRYSWTWGFLVLSFEILSILVESHFSKALISFITSHQSTFVIVNKSSDPEISDRVQTRSRKRFTVEYEYEHMPCNTRLSPVHLFTC